MDPVNTGTSLHQSQGVRAHSIYSVTLCLTYLRQTGVTKSCDRLYHKIETSKTKSYIYVKYTVSDAVMKAQRWKAQLKFI